MIRFIKKLFIIGVVLFMIHTYIGTMTIYYNNKAVENGKLSRCGEDGGICAR